MISANAALLSNDPVDLSAFGIDTISIDKAEAYLETSNVSVLGAHCRPGNYQAILRLLLQERRKNTNKRFLIFFEQLSSKQLIEINNVLGPNKTLPFSVELPFHEHFQDCFSDYYEREQNKQLLELVNEKNDELKKLTLDLERKVVERQNSLEASRQKNANAEKRLQVLKKTLLQIYQANSISEIEHGVSFALKKEFAVAGVQIRRPSQSNFSDKDENIRYYKTALKIGSKELGHIYFFKNGDLRFDAQEKRFLKQVAEAVSLSIERTVQYSGSQELKTQWEKTFDAISDPICLTDENYNILRINAGFLKQTGASQYQDHIGDKCYRALFNRDSPCEGCMRGQIFQIRNPAQTPASEVYDVYSNNLGDQGQAIYFQMYRDVTKDLNLQRQVIESAKMAELGTISSSIAHELNNPIGGMLNFAQLIKMDLDGDEDFYDDILEIEKGIIKCKNIVKSLLGFARKSFNAEITEINLVEVIEQAIKITELKTRSIGIVINFHHDQPEYMLNGRFNLLTHAFRNILQNSQESLIAKRRKNKHFKGLIEITISNDEKGTEIVIRDNGDGAPEEIIGHIFDPLFTTKDPETNSGLGLTLALQIVKEHNGTIKVSIDKDKKLCLITRFFKSEVQSGLSEF